MISTQGARRWPAAMVRCGFGRGDAAAVGRFQLVRGASHEIMAITGHKSLSQVQGYTVAAEQARRADAAIDKLENGQ